MGQFSGTKLNENCRTVRGGARSGRKKLGENCRTVTEGAEKYGRIDEARTRNRATDLALPLWGASELATRSARNDDAVTSDDACRKTAVPLLLAAKMYPRDINKMFEKSV